MPALWKSKMAIRITGDCHGKIDQYVDDILNSNCSGSLQVGDMGFDYKKLNILDSSVHKFYGGNHENYDLYENCPYSLGDYGFYELLDFSFFFIRGAFSIDYKHRQRFDEIHNTKSWWAKEELNLTQMNNCFELYKKLKPKYLLTHTCPSSISNIIGNPRFLHNMGFDPDSFTTNTQEFLQSCFDFYKPKVHIYGHFHQNLDFIYKGTRFICLDELCHIDIVNGKILNKNKTRKINHPDVKNCV